MFAAAASRPESLSVIDPCNRTGKITVPTAFVTETKGVTDFLKYGGNPPPDAKDLSLCLLFQKGRCNAGARCNQVHVATEFIDEIRTRARTGRTCCARHGDVHSTGLAQERPVVVQVDGETKEYVLGDFAVTPSLEVAISRTRSSAAVRVQGSRICRLHQRGSCKFGRDCKNVHLCRDAIPLAATRPPAAAPATNTVPAPVYVTPVQAPPLGLAFRAVDIADRSPASADLSCASCAPTTAHASWCEFDGAVESFTGDFVKPLSVLSIMSEFNSMRATDAELDPLDIIDEGSSCSGVSASDFGAFVDSLVQYRVEPMASPQWLAA